MLCFQILHSLYQKQVVRMFSSQGLTCIKNVITETWRGAITFEILYLHPQTRTLSAKNSGCLSHIFVKGKFQKTNTKYEKIFVGEEDEALHM